jgi:hypothetical protein
MATPELLEPSSTPARTDGAAGTAVAASPVTGPPSQVRPTHDDATVLPVPAPRAAAPSEVVDVPVADLVAPVQDAPAPVQEVPATPLDTTRGTPLQALAGWSGALAAGVACWAGVAAVVSRAL